MSCAVRLCGIARQRGIQLLLIDTTQLTGFGPPHLLDRFELARRCAEAADSKVEVAFVARSEMIDPDRFETAVARNRGFWAEMFDRESEAERWLLDPLSP